MLGAFGEHYFVTHIGHHSADFVGINQLGVPESSRFLSEKLFDFPGLCLYLFGKLFFAFQSGEGVGIRLGQKFHISGGGQLLKTFEHIGGIGLKLVESRSRNGKTDFESTAVFVDKVEQQGVHRQVVFACHLAHNVLVVVVVEIILFFTDVEKAVTSEPHRLVYLKIKTNSFHMDCVILN